MERSIGTMQASSFGVDRLKRGYRVQVVFSEFQKYVPSKLNGIENGGMRPKILGWSADADGVRDEICSISDRLPCATPDVSKAVKERSV